MQILHFDLKTIQGNSVELRCFEDNPYDYEVRSLALNEIESLIQQAEAGYYAGPKSVDDLVTIGRRLFQWLDGSEHWLGKRLSQALGEERVLAITVAGKLANLPWEVLHDGGQFLVQRQPAVVPVRWLSSDAVMQLTVTSQPRNRALNVLFMATSPLEVEPVLNYEQEEAQILNAAARSGIGLTVEESGCLEELGYLVDGYEKDVFDVVHLTGHALIQDGQPRFITETATGAADYASATEIAQTLGHPLPPLVFLSGCRTGQAANQGAVPSMAEQLLQAGATAVLGWGQNVLDTDATAAAAALYEPLSRSRSLIAAVGSTYQALIQQQARDWHLLRLYVAKTLPGSLVKPDRTPGWKPAPKPSMATEFLDPVTRTVKVPTRDSFVGRRRQLQHCIRALIASPDQIAVLIHGMGGLGKSSLAARLCDRLTQFKRLVWRGRIDPQSLVHHLVPALDDQSLRQRLQDPAEPLRYRLRGVFDQLAQQGAPPFLLVLDDFEENLEAEGAGYRLKSPAQDVLEALFFAIEETPTRHRLILTSRYDFELDQSSRIYKQPLDGLQGADLQKKCEQLSALKPPQLDPDSTEAAIAAATQTAALQDLAKQIADGNPRLLEHLNDQVLTQPTIDRVAELKNLSQDRESLRERVLEPRVLQQMQELEPILARGLVFELPVPRSVFEAVCGAAPQPESQSEPATSTPRLEVERGLIPVATGPAPVLPIDPIAAVDRAIALGLLEVSPDQMVRVPRILPLSLPEDAASLYVEATQALYSCWRQAMLTEAQALEVHRLALVAKNAVIAAELGAALGHRWHNQSRFREAVALGEKTVALTSDYRICHSLARSQATLGEVAAALVNYQKALAACPEADQQQRSAILHNSAEIYAQQGQMAEAINLYQQSLALDELTGDVQGKAATLHGMAIIYAQQGKAVEAIDLYQQSLVLYESIGDVQGKAPTLRKLGGIYQQQGQLEKAMSLFQESLSIEQMIGNVQGRAEVLGWIAGIYAQQGKVAEAIDLYQQSLVFYESIGDVQGKAATLAMLGQLLADKRGDVATGLSYLQQSLEILQRLKSRDAQTVVGIMERLRQQP